jgi:putative membrane protein insertion efficiency factor
MSVLARALALLVRAYQLVARPLLPPACRFYPSCSEYAIEALHTHGAMRGAALACWRVLRCNPFVPGGYDPVPEACCCALPHSSETRGRAALRTSKAR